tara:strand:- start:343 stop:546 length:204 start_codon:yes stop_codon:yes gene_type:complete
MYVTSNVRMNDVPLDVFRLMVQLEGTRLCVGDIWVWVNVGDVTNEIQFFLNREDSAIYKKEIGEEEE